MKKRPLPQGKRARDKPLYVVAALGVVLVLFLAVWLAPYLTEPAGFLNILKDPPPFRLTWTSGTPKVILVCLLFYGLAVAYAFSSRHKYHRRGEEQGSADWAETKDLQQEFHSDSPHRVIYTQNFAISYEADDLYKHKRNLNSVLIGGPGSGKTRGFVYPNCLEADGRSIVCLDPKGEVCRTCGGFLKKQGYEVRVLDLVHLERSWRYNPFDYIDNDDDVQKVADALFKATTEKTAQTTDPFWDKAGLMLLSAVMYLLVHFGAPEEKNFSFVMKLIRADQISDEDDSGQPPPLDLLFQKVEALYPEHICVRYFQNYRSAAGKTKQSVQITLLARLQKFDLDTVKALTSKDEMKLDEVGDRPTALFLCIPEIDASYNFLVSLLYIQLFDQLYRKADDVYHGRLPCFVHVVMDEFANVHTPDDFLAILATCRSRNIGIAIILQNFAQLKEKYKEGWENIIGQCDEFLFLNGNEYSAHEQVSKMLGKETVDTNSFGRQYGMQGHYTTNYQTAGRELLTPDEVRLLPYEYAIMIVKNAPPLVDKKYDCAKHPNAGKTSLSGDKTLDYFYGTREERCGEPPTENKPEPQAVDPLDTVMLPPDQESPYMSLDIMGDSVNGAEAAAMLSEYSVSADELEAYLLESTSH